MSRTTDPNYLRSEQYNNTDKLAARIRLHRRFSTNPVNIYHWMFDHLLEHTLVQPNRILELGCGRGDLWHENAARIPDAWEITLTDFSPGMLEDCQRHLGDLAPRFSFQAADAQHIPYPAQQFDVVLANMMLYHVPDLKRALAEIRRVLHPGGVLFAMTNGDNHLHELYRLAEQFEAAGQSDPSTVGYTSAFRHTFSLQNGAEQLKQQFAGVQMHPYEDSLAVTEVGPLLDYLASMISAPGERILSEHGQQLAAAVEQQIAEQGAFRIRKETGLFIARSSTVSA